MREGAQEELAQLAGAAEEARIPGGQARVLRGMRRGPVVEQLAVAQQLQRRVQVTGVAHVLQPAGDGATGLRGRAATAAAATATAAAAAIAAATTTTAAPTAAPTGTTRPAATTRPTTAGAATAEASRR